MSEMRLHDPAGNRLDLNAEVRAPSSPGSATVPPEGEIPIWDLCRVRIWQIVKRVMIEARIPDAPHRSPKGLRHGFGINATVNGAPLHMVRKWMGHAQLSTPAIYADAVGEEEQHIVARMWG